MRDRILTAFLEKFVNEFGLGQLDEPSAFEHLTAHCVISKHTPENFEPGEVVVAGSGDIGLDGVGILVNDHLVSSVEDVNHFQETLRRLDVQFVFVQAKTSPRFDSAGIGTFVSGVRQFFESHPPGAHEQIVALHGVKEHIFDRSIDMDRVPMCRLYYVTTGNWQNDAAVRARIEQGVKDLRATDLFSDVEFTPMDAERLKGLYRELNQKITRQIKFEKHTILPDIANVQEAYIGIVPCKEVLNLIRDDQGNLNRRLFYDNVRDFQGHNAVNQEIETTVRDANRSDRFALLNNGITIVARDANKIGAAFTLRDYQIVNGCQTSHVLFLNREGLTNNVYVPLKLIVTSDAEVTNQIIQGTNRQTEVKLEAFESLAPFQKGLEEFYVAVGRNRDNPIYYERRSKQYEQLNIRRERIITLATQVKCFVGMFLNEPHSTHRYYGELLNSYRGRLFSDSHATVPYYVSGIALSAIERLFAEGLLARYLRPYRFQILMVFRLTNEHGDLPRLDDRRIEEYCQGFIEILDDVARYEQAFLRAGEIVRLCRSAMGPSREPVERTRAFTSALISAAGRNEEAGAAKAAMPASASRMCGKVKMLSDTKGYGFVRGDDDRDYFVQYTRIEGSGFRSVSVGQRVEFTPINTARGLQAIDVATVK